MIEERNAEVARFVGFPFYNYVNTESHKHLMRTHLQ